MDYRTQKELLGESRLSALFSPLLANRWLWLEAILIPIIGIGLCWLVSREDPFFINKGEFPWTWFAPVLVYQALYPGFQLQVLLVFALGRWSAYDQRSPCIVDQHAINLIDHGVVVLALHLLLRSMRHIVAQVVKTEFIVCTVSDIGTIRF